MYFLLLLLILNPLVQGSNILGVFMSPSPNDQLVYQPIWRELSLRGHKVTVLTPDPLNDPTLTNLTEISLKFAYDLVANSIQEVSSSFCPYETLINTFALLDAVADRELNSSEFRRLINDQDQSFDLILSESTHPVMYALAHRFQAPLIAISPEESPHYKYDAVGNPNHPVLYPELILNLPKELSIWQKIQSVWFFVWSKMYYHNVFIPRTHYLATKYFGDDIPYIGDIERNISLFFINTNFVMYPMRANVPAIVDIGQINIRPPEPLPNNLKSLLDEATKPVIYVNLKGASVDKKLRDTFVEAMSELPYEFLWNWELQLPGKPKNVVIRKMLPQQDILAHRNVRAFITQGDIQYIDEAIAARVPLIGVPFKPKQVSDVQRVENLEIGRKIDPATITKIELKNVIVEVTESARFKKKLKKLQNILFDKPMSGLASAVWWSEYVIRHQGARHLRSPAIEMTYVQYLLIDVALVLILAVCVVLYLSYKLLSLIFKKRPTKKIKTN